MEQQRKEATERLLSRQGHHNLVYNEENGGVGVEDEGLVAVSNFTSILGLSTLTAACITFGFGCAIGYSSPTQSSIMEDLGLSVAEFSLFGSILSIGSLIGAAISGKITDLFGRKPLLNVELQWITVSISNRRPSTLQNNNKECQGKVYNHSAGFGYLLLVTARGKICFITLAYAYIKDVHGLICTWRSTTIAITIRGIFFIFSAFSFANFILTATMVPETKGRTLEEIRASITHSSD
ncbi:hypothetical protein PVK06_041023 [Gossypium arboreum]|uniref:Uncharacterized protein n=1 Tax=Gossypium arboreum TaxID=29729 RepID=A0ABR0N995_GOSAR|nr:hypothetical protein PVK06_041023 [Gossypium arboreum]